MSVQSIIAIILYCFMLRFLYKTIFLKNDQNRSINNGQTKGFIKTLFVVFMISLVTFFIAFLVFIVFLNTPYNTTRMEHYPSVLFNFLDILIFSQVPAIMAYFIFSLSVYYIQNGFGLGITFKLTLKSFQTKSVFVILLLAIISSLLIVAVDSGVEAYEDQMRHKYYDEMNSKFLDNIHNPSSEPVNGLSSDVDINELINQNFNQEAVEPIAPKAVRIPFWVLGLDSFVKSLFFVFVFIYSAIIASKTLESNSFISSDKDSNEVSF